MKSIFFWNNRNLAGLLVALAVFTSCKKLIEIPPAPKNAITQESQLVDSANVVNAIVANYIYINQSSAGIPYGNSQLILVTGHSSDELAAGANNFYNEFSDYAIVATNGTMGSTWRDMYKWLFSINAIINTVSVSTTMSPSFIKQATGEMKVMRAFYYFDMVNLFGGVPLVLNSDYKTTASLPRASVEEVYAQIIKDLTEASNDLIPAYPSAGRLRPNQYTALTLLAKAHLYRQDWQKAYDAADRVIKSGLYTLEPDLNRVFLDGSTEAIWQITANSPNGTTNESSRFIPANATSTPGYTIAPSLLTALGLNVATGVPSVPTDQRYTKWVGKQPLTVGGVPRTFYYPFKYKNRVITVTPVENYMMFRLGEVYLIRAEAAARLNKLTEALADVNIIRARAGLPASTANAASQTDVLNAVMKERQTELFTEWSNRWYDLKRTGMAATVLGALRPAWKPEAALYPIPQSQINLNFNLVQNPGY